MAVKSENAGHSVDNKGRQDRAARYNISIAVLTLLLIAMLLGYNGIVGYQQSREFELVNATTAAKGAAIQVGRFIVERQRMVSVFANDHVDTLATLLAGTEQADESYAYLVERTAVYFPDYFAVTVFDKNVQPVIDDFDGMISDLCFSDARLFEREGSNRPRIHPNPGAYHFDIMAPWHKGEDHGILFVSFHADFLGQLLRVHQISGHQLLLVDTDRQNLIEVTPDGARNKWIRDDYRMQPPELERVMVEIPVEGTSWHVLDLREPNLFTQRIRHIVFESVLIFSVFLLLALGSLWLLRREGLRRQRAERAKDEFISLVSHELRTPLTAIRGVLGLISNGVTGSVDEKSRDMAKMALNNAEQLGLLVDDMLDMQKIRAGKLEFHKEYVSLVPVVEHTVASYQSYAQRFGSQFELVCRADELPVFIDTHRVEQALANLMSNAVKYGAKNDTIVVTVDRVDGRAHISVTDHGEGVPPAFREKLFDAFSQAGVQRERVVKGTGLGLYIVAAIVGEHDGQVGFTTELNAGSTFYIELPLRNPE